MGKYLDNKVYDNIDLCKKIDLLEEKYLIVDESNKFKTLVNFSENYNNTCSNWFRYREGFANSLVQFVIDDSKLKKGDIIVDPFCGSGTTQLVGKKNHINSFGLDVNPISILLCNFKAKYFTKELIQKYENAIKYINFDFSFDYESYLKKYDSVRKYFSEQNFQQLLAIKKIIDNTKDIDIKEFLLLGYMCIIEETSNRKRDGNGLKTVTTKVKDVLNFYIMQLNKIITDIKDSLLELDSISITENGSAMQLSKLYFNYFSTKCDCILFSPPYANSFDYFESYKLEIVLCDFADTMLDINKYRENALSSFISKNVHKSKNKLVNKICEEINKRVIKKESETGKKDARTRKVPNMLKGYFDDMERVLIECSNIMKDGSRLNIVVDQSSYVGCIIPTDLLICEIAERVGFKIDKLIFCRNARTSSQQSKKFNYLNSMLRECIIVLVKEDKNA